MVGTNEAVKRVETRRMRVAAAERDHKRQRLIVQAAKAGARWSVGNAGCFQGVTESGGAAMVQVTKMHAERLQVVQIVCKG
jgi:uncharacterized protein (DUF2237 family)